MISESVTAFSLGPEDQIELEKQGVSETIIQAMIKAKADADAERQLIEQYETENPAPAAPAAQTEKEAEAEKPAPAAPGTPTEKEAEAERRLIEQYETQQRPPGAATTQTEEATEAERRLIEQYEAERAPATAEQSTAPAGASPPVVDRQVAESYTRGLSDYRNRQYQEAMEEFTKVAAAEPDRADVHYLIGYCHLMLRQYEQSLAEFRLSFAKDPRFDPRSIYQQPPSQ